MINVSHIFWSVCKSALIYSVGLTWQQIYRIQNPHLQWSHLPLNIQAIIKEAPRWFTVFASFWAKAGIMTNFEEKNRLNKEDFVEKDDYCKQLGGKQMGIEGKTLGV